MRVAFAPLVVSVFVLCACGDDEPAAFDAGFADAGSADAAAANDAGVNDAGFQADAGEVVADAGSVEDGGLAGRTIADPGPTVDRWAPEGTINVPNGHGTPETAWLVGTVTEDPWYIGGTTDAMTGDVFWVFRTDATLTTITIPLRGFGLESIDHLHLHDGEGLVFGAEIQPDRYEMFMDGNRPAIDATFTVLGDHVYVVEVHGTEGTFF